MKKPEPNKHQARSEATRAALLASAEKIFVRDGYERAQLDEVAADSGRTRGSIYTHFESKEDLFLSLLEERLSELTRRHYERFAGNYEKVADGLEIGRKLFCEVREPNIAILSLELKLFAIRRPESAEHLRTMYRRVVEAGWNNRDDLVHLKTDPEYRCLLFGATAVANAIALEAMFDPEIMIEECVSTFLGRVFDGVVNPIFRAG